MAAHDIIIKPLLSEKSYAGIKDKKYSFIVAKDANKTQIKLAVEEIFGVKVEKVRFQKNMAVIKLAGIDDRNASELLRGKDLFIEKSEFDLGEDTYFTDELTGCAVVDEEGNKLGTLAEVIANPAHDLYRVEREDGSSFLMPAVKAFITALEPENRLIRVSLPEGLTSL